MSDANEQWKDVPGFEGYYQVSSTGRVRSLDRLIKHSKRGELIRKGRVLKLRFNKSRGYFMFSFYKDGKATSGDLHRFIMKAFNGESNLFVDHKDGNKQNNNVDNLRYCTPRANSTFDNVKRTNKTGFMGVSKYARCKDNPFIAGIRISGEVVKIGCYPTAEAAHEVYNKYSALMMLRPPDADNSDIMAMILAERQALKLSKTPRKHTEEAKRKISAAHQNHPNKKLTDSQVAEIRRLHSEGVKQSDIRRKFGLCPSNVSQIISRHRYNNTP